MLDYIIIGMILHQAWTGYDIKKEIDAGVGKFYRASYGSLYPALRKLTEKGYLTMTEEMEGNRLKKYYQATALGKELFLEWLSSPLDPKASGEAQLAKIYFYGELPKEIRDRCLGEFEFYARQVQRQLEEIEKQFFTEDMDDRGYYEFSTLYYGLQNARTTIRWLGHIKGQKPLSKFLITGD